MTFSPNPPLDPAVPSSQQLVGVVAQGYPKSATGARADSGINGGDGDLSTTSLLVVNLGGTDVDVGLDSLGFTCPSRCVPALECVYPHQQAFYPPPHAYAMPAAVCSRGVSYGCELVRVRACA